jgi:hypothetical protein
VRYTAVRSSLVALTLFAAVACDRDADPVTAPAAGRAVSNAAVADDSAWDTFVADVNLTSTQVDSIGRRRAFPALHYHMERSRRGAGWRTQLIVDPLMKTPARAGRPFDPDAKTIRRVDIDETGKVRLFNAQGSEIAEPDTAALAALRTPIGTSVQPFDQANRPKGPVARGQAKGSTWVEAYLSKRGDAATRIASADRQLGKGRRLGKSIAYQRNDGATRREMELDADTGLPTSRLITQGDSASHLTQYLYESAEAGVIVHRGSHTESRVGRKSSILDINYTNVHLEKRQGAQP